MQPLARENLTAAQVTALLQASALEVTGGCELLAPDLSLVADISDDLVGGKVSRSLYATIHGTCDLTLTRALRWGVDLVRPFTVLSDGVVSARFDLGVFVLTTPERKVGEVPETVQVSGFDRLHLLNRQVGADYTVAAGTTYRAAILAAFTAAGLTGVLIDGAAADDVLPAARLWPLVTDRAADPDQTDTPVTWLRIVNDLLRAINFRSVWCDEAGRFRCGGYQPPSSRPVEFTFDADDLLSGIVGEDRTVIEDVWNVPNRWVFRQSNRAQGAPAATEGDGIYTVNLSNTTIGDSLGRTLVWTSVIDYEAASQAKLVSLGDRRVQTDRAVTAQYDVTVGHFPPAGHADVYLYRDAAVGGERRVQLIQSEIDLTGGDTVMRWEAVQ